MAINKCLIKTGDCNNCVFWRGMNNRKYRGVRIPGGSGKCCCSEGHCNPATVRGKIGEG